MRIPQGGRASVVDRRVFLRRLANAKLVPAGNAAVCSTNEFVDQARA
jgi:hypothetical protein